MNQLEKEINALVADGQFDGKEVKEIALPDYDDQPYGDDNILVRASKRSSYLTSALLL